MFIRGDCLDVMRGMKEDSVDLVFCSPPYEAARTYGIGFNLSGQEWVDWAKERFLECIRVCRGLVAWVVAGRTRKFAWSATPALLQADLFRSGVQLRNPPIYHRSGIPGSGGPDWFRNCYETIICAAGILPWSDNLACGKPPKYRKGSNTTARKPNGERNEGMFEYDPPAVANPGNVFYFPSGGGHGYCGENEAPFPEGLAEIFIRSFAAPRAIVLDPFCGSGTTCLVAKRFGRESIGIDIRESQIELSQRRWNAETVFAAPRPVDSLGGAETSDS